MRNMILAIWLNISSSKKYHFVEISYFKEKYNNICKMRGFLAEKQNSCQIVDPTDKKITKIFRGLGKKAQVE